MKHLAVITGIIITTLIVVGFFHNSTSIEEWGEGGRFSVIGFSVLGALIYAVKKIEL